MENLKDRVSNVHEASKNAAIARLPGFDLVGAMAQVGLVSKLQDRGFIDKLSAGFDNVVSTMAISPAESDAASEVIAQHISKEDMLKEMKGKDPEYVVSMLSMLGLMPAPDNPELKAKAFAMYVRVIQDNDPELLAKIEGWEMEDMQKKLSEELRELILKEQKIDEAADKRFMLDLQDEQNLLIATEQSVVTVPGGGLHSESSLDDCRNVVRDAVQDSKAKVADRNGRSNGKNIRPEPKFSSERLEQIATFMHSMIKNNPGMKIESYQINPDGEINFYVTQNARVMGLRIPTDAAFEEMKMKGEAATVAPGLMFYTEKPNDLSNNFTKGFEAKSAVGAVVAQREHGDDPEVPNATSENDRGYSTPFNTNPYNTDCTRK